MSHWDTETAEWCANKYGEYATNQLGIEALILDASADVVLAFDSYDHWQDQAKGLQEVLRVLKPGGQFVVVKDGGLPNAGGAKKAFLGGLIDAGFSVAAEHIIKKDDVSFTQWVCICE